MSPRITRSQTERRLVNERLSRLMIIVRAYQLGLLKGKSARVVRDLVRMMNDKRYPLLWTLKSHEIPEFKMGNLKLPVYDFFAANKKVLN
ncbi:CUN094 hypothetical protein [Culex nigripalpus nucleopolyhedrovirus]|uniref:Uncharacterized protein n=1 Tax=Culex nigripalpus nucleopolyhedrovirus (isolate Florida/1997) TaxID=645993 RepID=Q919I3_NPVCO|nr:CUN094 hypothetical protein [Culex nigripalpus nucleopolyhedrovirus]AAK94172.1 CUN094 hypothetical protein [Culex nigripalpus nucleopolyhedrovirus]